MQNDASYPVTASVEARRISLAHRARVEFERQLQQDREKRELQIGPSWHRAEPD